MRTELTTDRLTLRPFRRDEARYIELYCNDWDVAKNLARVPYPYPKGLAETWVASHQESRETGLGYTFAVCLADEPIGCLAIDKVAEPDDYEFGYWYGKPYWGLGIATEAGQAAIRFAWDDLGLDHLISGCFEANLASGRVLKKLGFVVTGRENRWSEPQGRHVPALVLRLDKA